MILFEEFFDDIDDSLISDENPLDDVDIKQTEIKSYSDLDEMDITKRNSISFLYRVYEMRKLEIPIVDIIKEFMSILIPRLYITLDSLSSIIKNPRVYSFGSKLSYIVTKDVHSYNVLGKEYYEDVTQKEILDEFKDIDYKTDVHEYVIITITFDMPDDNISFDKLYKCINKINRTASSIHSNRPKFIISCPYRIEYIFRNPGNCPTFNSRLVQEFYNEYYKNHDNQQIPIYKTDLHYNGPVKLSSLSEKKLDEFSIGDFLYADSDGNLVSQDKDESGKKNDVIAFYIGDGFFASIRTMDPVSPTTGTMQCLRRRDANIFTYYGFSDIYLSKKKVDSPTFYYEKGLEILNKGQVEDNWKTGPFNLSDESYKFCGLMSPLFNACAIFRTPGTKKGDWFIPSEAIAKNIANAADSVDFVNSNFDELTYKQLKNIYSENGYRTADIYFYTSEDISKKYSKVVKRTNGITDKAHKLIADSSGIYKILVPVACIQVI